MTKIDNQNAADTPIDPAVNLQQDTKVGNSGFLQPSDAIKKTDGTSNFDKSDQKQSVMPVDSSEETDTDDVAQRSPYQDPAITCTGVNIPLNETILSSGIKSYSFTVSYVRSFCIGDLSSYNYLEFYRKLMLFLNSLQCI